MLNGTAKKSIDRRVARTRKLLSEALSVLILEKGYDAVSIRDILERSGVGRATFYLHFENKEQLMLWGHDNIRNLILEDGGARIGFLPFYRHLEEHRALVLSILSGGPGGKVSGLLRDILRRNILRLHPSRGRGVLAELRAEAAAAAVLALLTEWLRLGAPYPAAWAARESERLIRRIVAPRARDGKPRARQPARQPLRSL